MDSRQHGRWTTSAWRLILLLALWIPLGTRAEPPSFTLPGRPLDSQEPWGAFLGKAAHDVLGRTYQSQHPSDLVFINNDTLETIVRDGKLGDSKRLSAFVRLLRPDITNTKAFVLFEIKPDTEWGRKEARAQAANYLAALNAVVEPDKKLSPGLGFEGSLFLDFENGGSLWRLSWRTAEPGVTLYRWSFRRKTPQASWVDQTSQKEEELPTDEAARRGELAERALRAAYQGVALPCDFNGHVYLPVYSY